MNAAGQCQICRGGNGPCEPRPRMDEGQRIQVCRAAHGQWRVSNAHKQSYSLFYFKSICTSSRLIPFFLSPSHLPCFGPVSVQLLSAVSFTTKHQVTTVSALPGKMWMLKSLCVFVMSVFSDGTLFFFFTVKTHSLLDVPVMFSEWVIF